MSLYLWEGRAIHLPAHDIAFSRDIYANVVASSRGVSSLIIIDGKLSQNERENTVYFLVLGEGAWSKYWKNCLLFH